MPPISASDIFDTVSNGLLVLDTRLTVVSANRCFYQMFDVDADATLGQRLYDLGNGQWNIPELRRLLEDILPREQAIERYEVEHTFPALGHRIMHLNARKVFRPGNHVEFVLLAIHDVTREQMARHEAERAHLLMQGIVDTFRDPLLILESDMTVVTASRSFLNLFGITAEQIIGQPLASLSQGQWKVDALQTLLARVVPDEEPLNDYLIEDEFPGLGRRIFKLNARKVFRPGNHVTRLLVVFEDATDATLADRHKDLMAAELAHRIKNNLQVISSFVAFEMRRAAEPCLAGYQAMQTRISAVAELYDLIARSSALGPVAMNSYLEGIAGTVRASLLGSASGIRLNVEAEPLHVQADHAVPLGLIANELATNAVKYAFPQGIGQITLGFGRRDGDVTLTVTDNGVGLGPAGSSSGLGSRFVEAFVKQLGGVLAAATGPSGTTFTVRLPVSVLAEA